MQHWIQTRYGEAFDYANINPDTISIQDIEWHLSQACRYGGATIHFYSVAEHCVHVANWVYKETMDRRVALTALLHDASEAYMGDVPAPLKALLPDYRRLEHRVEETLALKFNLVFPFPAIIKLADERIMANEREVLMVDPPKPWSNRETIPLDRTVIQAMSPPLARNFFRQHYQMFTATVN